jgi:hypothetical protein
MRVLLLTATVAAMSLGSVAAQAAPPPKGRPLGGVNLTYYCQVHYGEGYKAAVIDPGTAYDWRCVSTNPKVKKMYSISVQSACVLQYGIPNLTAYTFQPSVATSWKCYNTNPPGPGPRH